jgi:hypothetical protein
MRKIAPRFEPDMNPRDFARILNDAMQDLYAMFGNFSVAAPLRLYQSQSGGIQIAMDDDDTFIARLTGVYTPTSGTFAGINIYSFVEQAFDGTGFPVDKLQGRYTIPNPPVSGSMPTASWAIEVNNALLTVPGSTPPGFTNPGPYVRMRQLGQDANGFAVYRFEAPATTSGGSSLAVYNGSSEIDAAVVRIDSDANGVVSFGEIAAGHVQLAVAAASASQNGVVNTGVQTIGGNKTFANAVTVSGTFTSSTDAVLDGSVSVQGSWLWTDGANWYGGTAPSGTSSSLYFAQTTGDLQIAASGPTANTTAQIDIVGDPTSAGLGGVPSLILSGETSGTRVTPQFAIEDSTGTFHAGASGTDGGGSVFLGGICTTVGTGGGYTSTIPATSSATGTAGQYACDGSYLYICSATNTWRRVAVSSF